MSRGLFSGGREPVTDALVVGIFVGGRAARMGGVDKWLLPVPDTGEPIAGRLARLCREALPSASIVLVGTSRVPAPFEAECVEDEPPGVGPLGGLAALLACAERRASCALAFGGDMPYVSPRLLTHLAGSAPAASALAPKLDDRWHPLFARYEPSVCLPIVRSLIAQRRHALHGVFDALGERASVLPLDADAAKELRDWDTPADRLATR